MLEKKRNDGTFLGTITRIHECRIAHLYGAYLLIIPTKMYHEFSHALKSNKWQKKWQRVHM